VSVAGTVAVMMVSGGKGSRSLESVKDTEGLVEGNAGHTVARPGLDQGVAGADHHRLRLGGLDTPNDPRVEPLAGLAELERGEFEAVGGEGHGTLGGRQVQQGAPDLLLRLAPHIELTQLLRLEAKRLLGSAALATVAPRWWHGRRRARLSRQLPSWLAPDAALRAEMDGRLDRFIIEARPREGFYVRETRTTLRHPCVTGDLEEAHEFGRRFGAEMRHPFWDVDLVEFLCRVPPRFLDAGGRSKAPLRRMVAGRFPTLGVERQKKAHAFVFFDSMMRAEAPSIWAGNGGLRALGQLGVLDATAARAHCDTLLHGPFVVDPGRVFEVLTLETWARHKMN